MSALPVGNGRLGAMVHGGVPVEQLALNESTCWSGALPEGTDHPQGAARLAELQRQLIEENRSDGFEAFCGKRGSYGTHRPWGDLCLTMYHGSNRVTDYRRELILDMGLIYITYNLGSTRFTREVFASRPDQVVAVRLDCNEVGGLSFHISLDVADTLGQGCMEAQGADLLFHGKVFDGVGTHARLRVQQDGGEIAVSRDGIVVRNAKGAFLLLALGTSFDGKDPVIQCRTQIDLAFAKGYEKLRRNHMKDYRGLLGRVSLELGRSRWQALPTDERLRKARMDADPGLDVLMFQLGRYLMIAGSREDSPLPLHLQGIWNDNQACNMGWTCDYHLDINTQMNYWSAGPTHLTECNQPLFRWIEERLVLSGRRTARIQYGKKGWIAHTFSNAWGWSSCLPDENWGIFHGGAAWIALHLWSEYEFSGDKKFLREHAYPILKELAQFYMDFLVRHPLGWLVTAPSCSPEHGGVCVMPAADRALLDELFSCCIEASLILGMDETFREECRNTRSQLPACQISEHGQLQEWMEDRTDGHTGHRHMSHMVGLFPLAQITLEGTPELARAARLSLERRLNHPAWEDTGWSRAWTVCLWARLKEGDLAYEGIREIQRSLTDENLFVFHPPLAGAKDNIYELDGNTGLTAGMAEMLLQSHRRVRLEGEGLFRYEMELLPALPAAWSVGQVKGLRGRGGFVVDLNWKDYRLQEAFILSTLGGPCSILCSGLDRVQCAGNPVVVEVLGDVLRFETEVGQRYRIYG